jgi:hypothetical protein
MTPSTMNFISLPVRFRLARIALAEIAADDFAHFRHVPLADSMKHNHNPRDA